MADPTKVKPGEIDDFAAFVHAVQQDWANEARPAAVLATATEGDYNYPSFGDFSSAKTLTTSYHTKVEEFAKAFGHLNGLLMTIQDASKRISKNYKDAEALAGAKVGDVDQAMVEAQQDHPGPGAPGTPGPPGPGSTPGV